MPLMFIGYHLIRDLDDLNKLLKLMCLVAIIPAAVGVELHQDLAVLIQRHALDGANADARDANGVTCFQP